MGFILSCKGPSYPKHVSYFQTTTSYLQLDDVNVVVTDPLVALVSVRSHGVGVRMLYLPLV